jgi:PmbA protein
MRKEHELLSVSHKLIEMAREYGEAQVNAASSRVGKVKLEKNDYQIGSTGDSTSIALTIYRDKRKGSATTNDLSDAGLADMVEKAATIASAGIHDEKLAFSRPGDIVRLPLSDSKVADITPSGLFAMAETIFTPLLKDREISVDGASLVAQCNANCIVNTNGVSVSKETTRLSATVMGMGIRDGETTSFDYSNSRQRQVDGFIGAAATMINELTENLKSTFNPRKCQPYKGLIILSPEVAMDILLGLAGHHAHGNALKDNVSKWKDKLGQQVASPLLSVWGDPHNLEYLGASGFDSAGTPTGKRTLIDKGILQFYMESVDSASRRGTEPTGHENGLRVLMTDGGKGGIMELAKKAGTPVLYVHRFSGNLNYAVGDFSGVAKNSHMIVDGEKIPVSETMISGNAFDLLNSIVGFGESKNCHNEFRTGPIMVDGVTISVG